MYVCRKLLLYFNSLKHNGPERGYYPEPTKIILIMHSDYLISGKMFVAHHGFNFCTGASYLGGYIGDDESKRDWLKDCMEKWERNICAVTKTAGKYTR